MKNDLKPDSRQKSQSLSKKKKKILQIIMLHELYDLLKTHLNKKISTNINFKNKEDILMDNEIIRQMINEIILSNEYTLEGIAHVTRIPFEVIYDAAGGIKLQFSLPVWLKIIALYLQVKPALWQELIEKLKNKDLLLHSSLLFFDDLTK